MHTAEDPTTLTPLQWIKRGLNLPFTEIARRVANLGTSLTRSSIQIMNHRKNALALGKSIHIVVLTDRLGDIVAAGPTVRKIKKNDEYIIWLVRKRFAGILEFDPAIDCIINVSSYTETIFLKLLIKKARWTNLHIDGALCNMFGIKIRNRTKSGVNIDNYYFNGRLVDVYSLIATGKIAENYPRIYPNPNFNVKDFLAHCFSEPQHPIVIIHTISDENARSWTPDKSQNLAKWILENTNFNIVEVGLTPVLQQDSRIYLLRNSIALSCQFSVVAQAKIFIGVDSGFAHVANALGISSIFLIGAFKKFTQHVPWYLTAKETIIRSTQQVGNISEEEVILELSNLIKKLFFSPNND